MVTCVHTKGMKDAHVFLERYVCTLTPLLAVDMSVLCFSRNTIFPPYVQQSGVGIGISLLYGMKNPVVIA